MVEAVYVVSLVKGACLRCFGILRYIVLLALGKTLVLSLHWYLECALFALPCY